MKTSSSANSPMHEQVRDQLLNQLQTGELAPGTMIPPERKLAEQLGVSRHTVRQALSALETMGLVQIRHGSGILITESTPDAAIVRLTESVIDREQSISRIAETRRAVEPYVARLAAERRTDAELERLQELATYQPDEESQTNTEHSSFHREVARATHNPVLEAIMRTLITGPRRAEAFIKVIPVAREAWEREHKEIVQAIKEQDAARAELLMAAHLDSVCLAVDEIDKHPQ